MTALALALALVGASAPGPAGPAWVALGRDTTIATPAGTRAEVLVLAGQIRVRTWQRAAVAIRVSGGPDRAVIALLDAGVLRIRPAGAEGMRRPRISIGPQQDVTADVEVLRSGGDPPPLTIEITMPESMSLDISAIDAGLDIEGLNAPLRGTAVHGMLQVDRGIGTMILETLDGTVSVRSARGRVAITAPNGRAAVSGLRGSLEFRSVNGGIAIESSILDSATVRTYNGGIRFSGWFTGRGPLAVWTFNGDVTFTVAHGTAARFELATADGGITVRASLPAHLYDANRRGSLVLGDGGPRVQLETFHGNITVVEESQ